MKISQERDGHSCDDDIVKRTHKMLDQIDKRHSGGCDDGKSLDSVIDMLMEEGGVDGNPAAGDANGRRDVDDAVGDRPMPFAHHHLHDTLFHDH